MSHSVPNHAHDDLEGGKPATTMITLTPKEYESLFLTPKDARPPAPVTGTFANPVGIGTIALVLVILPWSLTLCELGGTNAVSLFVVAPGFIFVGFVLLIIAAIFSWVQGLTFPCYLFFTYGFRINAHLYNLAANLVMAMTIGGFSGLLWYLYNPLSNIYETVGGLLSNGQDTGIAAIGTAVQAAPFVRAISIMLIPYCIISGIFTIAAFRTNALNVILLLGLTFFYGLMSASQYHIGSGDLARSNTEQHVAAGFGIVSSLAAIWLTIHLTLASVGSTVNIPIFDLSSLYVKKGEKQQ